MYKVKEYVIDNSVLYYPNIDFKNQSNLKYLLSIWDTVYRIVPEGIEPNDNEQTKIAIKEGLIKNVDLKKSYLEEISEIFIDKVDTNLLNIKDDYNVIKLHKLKIDSILLEILRPIIIKEDNQWVYYSEKVAHSYMFFLSDYLSKIYSLNKFTDNHQMHLISNYYQNYYGSDVSSSYNTQEMYYCNIIIPTFIPDGVRRTDMDVLLNFRDKTKIDRAEFRSTLKNFIKIYKAFKTNKEKKKFLKILNYI